MNKIQFGILNIVVSEHAQFPEVRCCKLKVQLESVVTCVYSWSMTQSWGLRKIQSKADQELFSLGIKRPEHEADHSPLSNVGIKNVWTSPPHCLALHYTVLKYWGNLEDMCYSIVVGTRVLYSRCSPYETQPRNQHLTAVLRFLQTNIFTDCFTACSSCIVIHEHRVIWDNIADTNWNAKLNEECVRCYN
jgi:hypothetical protein